MEGRVVLRSLQAALALSWALAACAPQAQAPAQPAADGDGSEAEKGNKSPEDIQKMFKREGEPLAKMPVAGGKWSAYLEAKAAPTFEQSNNMLAISADLGWESELRCYVYDRVIDPGGAANTMISAAATKVNFKVLQPYFFDRDGLSPLIGIRGIYNVEQNGVMLAGDYKLMIMPRMEYPVVCEHDAPGFAESFARVTTDFVKSFKFESQHAKPQRGELWRVSLQDVPLGFIQNTMYRLENGHIRHTMMGARFVPRGPGELLFEDEVTVITSDKKGALVSGRYVNYENGEPRLRMDIEKTKKGYEYVGTIQDKELRGTFKAKQPLLSEYALLKRLKSLAGGRKKTSFEQWEYTPGVDPAQATQVSYAVTPENGGFVVNASTGQRGMVMRVDESGTMGQVLMPVGAQMIQADLVEEVGGL